MTNNCGSGVNTASTTVTASTATNASNNLENNETTEDQNDLNTTENNNNENNVLENSKDFKEGCSKLQRPKEWEDGEWEGEPFYYFFNNSSTTAARAANSTNSNTNDGFHNYTPLSNGFLRNSNSYTSLNALENATDQRITRRKKRGTVYRSRTDFEYKCFQDHEGKYINLTKA